jgi:hypothetical protein
MDSYVERETRPTSTFPNSGDEGFCSTLNITLEHLDHAMDWECWPVDEYGNFAVTQWFDEIPE